MNYPALSMNGPILIVEDDVDDQFIFSKIFSELQIGDKIKYFSNPAKALAFLREDPSQPFLIICDINLPVMSGLEFKTAIDRDPMLRTKSIPFVFLSTSIAQKMVDKAYKELTIQGFFQKSDDYEDLKRRLYSILDYWHHCQHPNSY
ncbi:response regulator [Cytophagaceae bacterium YF14B1]|uniref:Response regulator n=1 Tax=Xanthocytophaga flava TaxID=3048013 RepID=A0AAE3QQD7_9BACT|nr:response regulator [Xanthocytophaga flavus]MDJ1480818.1 response regulator [Xanthocytophaga flavus]